MLQEEIFNYFLSKKKEETKKRLKNRFLQEKCICLQDGKFISANEINDDVFFIKIDLFLEYVHIYFSYQNFIVSNKELIEIVNKNFLFIRTIEDFADVFEKYIDDFKKRKTKKIIK